MIIRATFKNILSFYEETSISFIASKSSSNEKQVLRAQKRDDFSILKSGLIYGANASGKSNIIKAIEILKRIVLGNWPRNLIEPFKLQDDSSAHPKLSWTSNTTKNITIMVLYSIFRALVKNGYTKSILEQKKRSLHVKKTLPLRSVLAPSNLIPKVKNF